jgi:hypothetical protein
MSKTLSAAFSLAFATAMALAPNQASATSVTAVGTPEPVFSAPRDACEKIDIPDTSARAFRDYRNVVHLISTHFVARESTGPTLDTVAHNCNVIYSSRQDGNPSAFDDDNWLASFFTTDGRNVAALVHSEYHGWTHPGMCTRRGETRENGQCWRNTISYALSRNGGYSFQSPPAPGNFVAGAPFPYDPATMEGAIGYYSPTNIVFYHGYYYAMINGWHNHIQRSGSCVMRTRNVFDPSSWRAWGGRDFDVSFLNPFVASPAGPLSAHVCTPVYGGVVESLVFDPQSRQFIATEMPNDRRYGPPGAYASLSTDLVHWSHPTSIVSDDSLESYDGPGRWHYGYSSILDSSSPDRNFSTLGGSPYLYYVRIDNAHGSPYIRTLFRIRLRVTQ